MTMGSGTLAVIPFVYQKARLSPRSAVLSTAMLTPRGEALVATATTAELTSPQVWLIPTDGTGMTRLTGRLTMLLGLSPDGKWAAYLSQRGPLGLRSDQADLRAVRLDGSEDRLIATSVTEGLPQPHAASFSFSPDGSRVALSDGTKLLVATFDGSLPRILEPVSTTVSGYRVAGWNSEGSEILLMSPPWLADEGRDILGFDPGTRQLRTIHTADGLYMYEAGWSRQPEGIRRHLMMVKAEHSARDGLSLMLMDVASGETEEIAQPACYGGVDLSEDERLLAYAVCRGDKNAGYTSEVRLWDEAAAGSDHILAVLPDKVTMLSLSPQGDQVLVGRHDTAGDPLPSVILTRTGSVRDLDPGWIPVGWSGRNRVVLADGYAAQRLALADPDTGIRIIYP